jgi:hypothetical protein
MMADSANEGAGRGTHPTPAAAHPDPGPAPEASRAAPGDEPPTGGLTAILGKLRDAAAAHDEELADPDAG